MQDVRERALGRLFPRLWWVEPREALEGQERGCRALSRLRDWQDPSCLCVSLGPSGGGQNGGPPQKHLAPVNVTSSHLCRCNQGF